MATAWHAWRNRWRIRRKIAALRKKRRTSRIRRAIHALAWGVNVVLHMLVIAGLAFLLATISPYHFRPVSPRPTVIYSSDGVELGKLYAEYRLPIRLSEVPRDTVYAILAAEDTRFFHHRGLDARGILRALWFNIRNGALRQGGSTITQQLVRIELLNDNRTWSRKIRESALAVRVERAYTKEQLLERYLNLVYFGDGAYGIEAAARTYFRKPALKLTLAESALLAGLIREPEGGNPRGHPAVAKWRQHDILNQMAALGWISEAERQQALRQPLKIMEKPSRDAWRTPYVVEAVRQELLARYGYDLVYHDGLKVYTTIDFAGQRAAERALLNAVRAGSRRHVGNGALISVDVQTGGIRAMTGGVDFRRNQFNRATQARRQPGSSFKAFIYLAAIERGYQLDDLAFDAPVRIGDWKPRNYGDRYYGLVNLKTALSESLNSVSVNLVAQISPYAVIDAARRLGISSPLRPDMSIALGTSEVSPLEMASAFAALANGGQSVTPYLIRRITDGDSVVYNHSPTLLRSVDAGNAYLITSGLRQVITQGTGKRADIGRPAAGKTGTTNRTRDAWFIGYTPQLATAVWLGNDDHSPMSGVVGGSLPAQAWAEYMRAALGDLPALDFSLPASLREVTVCAISGKLALSPCPVYRQKILPLSRIPTDFCNQHVMVDRCICEESGLLARSDCPNTMIHAFRLDLAPISFCPLPHEQDESAGEKNFPTPRLPNPFTPTKAESPGSS